MRRRLALALIIALLAAPRLAHADPATDMDEGLRHLQQGLPVLMHVLEVLRRDGPALLEVAEQATSAAQKGGANLTIPPPNGEMPSAETLAQKFRGLQALADTMMKARPILERMQHDLDPTRMHPDASSGIPHDAGRAPVAPSPRTSPQSSSETSASLETAPWPAGDDASNGY